MEIKKIELKDLSSAMEVIYNSSLSSNIELEMINDKAMFFEMFTETYLYDDIILLGAYIDDKLVGVIGIEEKNYIFVLYIEPMYQKMGIGSKLLNYSYSYINDDNVSVNAIRDSLDFYVKNGFDIEKDDSKFVLLNKKIEKEDVYENGKKKS